VTADVELDVWRREWRDRTEPFPALKRTIRRQNLRITAAVAAIAVCLILATVGAVRGRSSFMAGLVAGLSFASVVMGGYSWWVRRGAWRPAAQTTLAYADLAYKRAVAGVRTARFSFRFICIATILYAGFVAWNWRTFSATAGLVVAAMTIEILLLNDKRRRAIQGVETSRELFEQTKQFAEARLENPEER
jgi:Flp pilus assembly protein TadB